MLVRTAIAPQRVVLQQTMLHCLARDQLHFRVKRRANRQAALVKRILAVAGDDLAADFLGEIFACEQIIAGVARRDAERLRLGLVASSGVT